MTEKTILFKPEMVRAILEGRKTQTRRVLKPQPPLSFIVPLDEPGWFGDEEGDYQFRVLHPVGTVLWVREAWRTEPCFDDTAPSDIPVEPRPPIWYEADGAFKNFGKLRPSMFMCRWMSRITLEVTAVKVERLQDISDEDAFLEGVGAEMEYLDGMPIGYGSAIPNYRDLWESINGPGSWDANPWVAVYSFKRVPQP